MHAWVHVCVCMHVCMYACVDVCMHVMGNRLWNSEFGKNLEVWNQKKLNKKNGAEISEAGAKSAQQQPQRGGWPAKKILSFFEFFKFFLIS